MVKMSYDKDIDLMDTIEACRTCGIFFLTSSSYLRPIFTAAVDDPEMMHIRMELSAWKLEISEDDGYPQFICTGCIHEFQKIFNFRRSCFNIQEQLLHFYNARSKNQIQIKTEKPDEVEENVCDFVYVDDLSDTEFDGTPFNIPHVPIKEELIEEAAVPTEASTTLMDTANTNIQDESLQQRNQFQNMEGRAILDVNSAAGEPADEINKLSAFPLEASKEYVEANDTSSSVSKALHFECEYCSFMSETRQEHKLHLKRAHEIKDIECYICGKTFKSSSSARLKFHLKWHKLSKHIKCAQCGFYCTSRDILKDHVRQVHSKDSCEICGKFVFVKNMKHHMRTHGFDTLFECTFCTKVFRNSDDVNEHIILMHANENAIREEDTSVQDTNTNVTTEVLCAVCNKIFPSLVTLEMHMREQHLVEAGNMDKSNDEYKIVYSVKRVASAGNHDLLKSLTLEDDRADKFYCIKCNQNFPDPDALAQHEQQCQAAMLDDSTTDMFSNPYNSMNRDFLDNYEQAEQNIPEEGEEFVDNQDYLDPSLSGVSGETSENIDEGHQIPTFGCAQCSGVFESVEQLQEHHAEMHPKKSNFNCNICGKVYELKFSLNRHLKKHHA